MSVQTYNTIIKTLSDFCSAHTQIRRFECGSEGGIENFSTEETSFPILYATPTSISFEENINIFQFKIYCLDLLQKDESNLNEVLNDTSQILRDLTNYLRQNSDIDINILSSPSADPVYNFLCDYTGGWFINIEVEAEANTNECSIPLL